MIPILDPLVLSLVEGLREYFNELLGDRSRVFSCGGPVKTRGCREAKKEQG